MNSSGGKKGGPTPRPAPQTGFHFPKKKGGGSKAPSFAGSRPPAMKPTGNIPVDPSLLAQHTSTLPPPYERVFDRANVWAPYSLDRALVRTAYDTYLKRFKEKGFDQTSAMEKPIEVEVPLKEGEPGFPGTRTARARAPVTNINEAIGRLQAVLTLQAGDNRTHHPTFWSAAQNGDHLMAALEMWDNICEEAGHPHLTYPSRSNVFSTIADRVYYLYPLELFSSAIGETRPGKVSKDEQEQKDLKSEYRTVVEKNKRLAKELADHAKALRDIADAEIAKIEASRQAIYQENKNVEAFLNTLDGNIPPAEKPAILNGYWEYFSNLAPEQQRTAPTSDQYMALLRAQRADQARGRFKTGVKGIYTPSKLKEIGAVQYNMGMSVQLYTTGGQAGATYADATRNPPIVTPVAPGNLPLGIKPFPIVDWAAASQRDDGPTPGGVTHAGTGGEDEEEAASPSGAG